jgi:hypothetical protein
MPLCIIKVPPIVLGQRGPLLPVRIRLPDVVARLRNASPSILGTGLIDTGATRTCISKKAAAALALKPVGTIKIGGVGGANEHSLFRVTFEFVHEVRSAIGVGVAPSVQPVIEITDCEVVEADIDAQGLAMLIGRDVLTHSAFTYDGPTGTWTLEIPRTQPPGLVDPSGESTFGRSADSPVPKRVLPKDRSKEKTARKAAKKARKKSRGK